MLTAFGLQSVPPKKQPRRANSPPKKKAPAPEVKERALYSRCSAHRSHDISLHAHAQPSGRGSKQGTSRARRSRMRRRALRFWARSPFATCSTCSESKRCLFFFALLPLSKRHAQRFLIPFLKNDVQVSQLTKITYALSRFAWAKHLISLGSQRSAAARVRLAAATASIASSVFPESGGRGSPGCCHKGIAQSELPSACSCPADVHLLVCFADQLFNLDGQLSQPD